MAEEFKSGQTYSTSEYGIRGIRIPKYSRLDGSPVPGTEYWQSDFHYFGYDNATTKINRTKPQGLGYIYNLPGIKTVGDLIGYKIIRTIEKYNNQTNETLGGPVEIEYTIRGFFHDDQNDINNYYVSFATIKPTSQMLSAMDPNFTTNIYNLENRSLVCGWLRSF